MGNDDEPPDIHADVRFNFSDAVSGETIELAGRLFDAIEAAADRPSDPTEFDQIRMSEAMTEILHRQDQVGDAVSTLVEIASALAHYGAFYYRVALMTNNKPMENASAADLVRRQREVWIGELEKRRSPPPS